MRKILIKFLLAILNSSWLNGTPCKYEFVGNVGAFSLSYLKSSVEQNPHLLVRELIMEKNCPDYPHTHENGEIRPMNDQDVKDLQNL